MKYREIADGIFVDRPNRFIAHVEVNGAVETVHVKNTGRCRELLLPGTAVRLEVSDNPKRKTKYDLVAVHKQGLGWVNMDSQAPNKVVGKWLAKQGYDYIKPEFTYGKSRIDFYMEKGEQKYLMEVKGCTLEVDGIGYFPDAPTERGVKHLHELAQAQRTGYQCAVAFVIQMEGITEVRPNVSTQPEFGTALAEAKAAGVQVLHAPFGGCIREITDAAHFQCAAFDFQQVLLFALFHVKVDAGLAIGEFRLDIVVALFCKPLSYYLVGCLTVHIDPAKTLLVYRHKVVFRFAFRVIRHFQPHRRAGQQ